MSFPYLSQLDGAWDSAKNYLKTGLQIITANYDAKLANVFTGRGSPQGQVAAPVGAIYLRLDGGANTTLYVKESGTGSTGWTAK